MKKLYIIIATLMLALMFQSCGSASSSSSSSSFVVSKSTPMLVVVMNWNDYSENDTQLWHDKLFNQSYNSVTRWYSETTSGALEFIPVQESSGSIDDGVIIVNMNLNHPGGSDDTSFRDTYIKNAISNSEVVNNIDFQAYDTNRNGDIDSRELQIIFIVAGGEQSFGDPVDHSIWAHTWSFDSQSAPVVDGVTLMQYNGDAATSGSYARFGANHGTHTATIGIIAHELGHALFNFVDFYDNGGGSGLGWYDIMSSGGWAKQEGDQYRGDTPTQLSAFNKIASKIDMNTTTLSSSQTLNIKCSSNDAIKLTTSKANEYFLLECRDTQKANSDISFILADTDLILNNRNSNDNFRNRVFTILYHVDDSLNQDGTYTHSNSEDGLQTSSNHYNLAVVEKDTSISMTSTENIEADYGDVYTLGDIIDTAKTTLYDGTQSNYKVEIIDEDSINRTMRIKITR